MPLPTVSFAAFGSEILVERNSPSFSESWFSEGWVMDMSSGLSSQVTPEGWKESQTNSRHFLPGFEFGSHHGGYPQEFWDNLHMDVSKNNGKTPKSSILIGFWNYKPSILGYHYFWITSIYCLHHTRQSKKWFPHSISIPTWTFFKADFLFLLVSWIFKGMCSFF